MRELVSAAVVTLHAASRYGISFLIVSSRFIRYNGSVPALPRDRDIGTREVTPACCTGRVELGNGFFRHKRIERGSPSFLVRGRHVFITTRMSSWEDHSPAIFSRMRHRRISYNRWQAEPAMVFTSSPRSCMCGCPVAQGACAC